MNDCPDVSADEFWLASFLLVNESITFDKCFFKGYKEINNY